ncbi:MAG: hypothetical protein GKR90_08670 [Pseudomonadales bacterium]|nr:hypothetical protein [Pseudomonadales bacterium]
MMQVLVVAFVAICIYLYVRSKHLAKERWLTRLDLPGLWQWQEGDATLMLSGSFDKGSFVATEADSQDQAGEPKITRGEWRLVGHELTLTAPGFNQALEVTLYQPGSIGLEDESGIRRAYAKESSNVVPLRKG